MNLKADRLETERIFETKKLRQYDKEAVAKQCEQWGLYHRAFEDYSDRQDRIRVLMKTTRIDENAIIEFFASYEGEDGFDHEAATKVLRDMLKANRMNEMVVAGVADAHIDNLGLQDCIDLLEEHECLRGLHFLLSRHYKTTQKRDIHFRYLELCVELHEHDDLVRFLKDDPVCYDVPRVKAYLEAANLRNPQPLITFLDKHNQTDELEGLLQRLNLQAFVGGPDAVYRSDSDMTIVSKRDDSRSIEEKYARKIEMAEAEREEVESVQREEEDANTSRPFQDDESVVDFAYMIPANLENAEMLAIENSEMELYNLEVQLHDRPHMMPTE